MTTKVDGAAAEVIGREIHVNRLLNAPVELVWEMWTNPEHIKHWWGPRGFTNTIYKMDFKKGGDWEFTMHGPDGKDYFNKHTYTEIEKHKKLVLLHEAPRFELTVTFTDKGGKTKLDIVSRFESAEMLQQIIKAVNAAEGLKQNIDKLEEYLQNTPAKKELVIIRQFNAPRELVFKAWTDGAHLAKWWGPQGLEMVKCEIDLRPGGMFHYGMKTPDGNVMWGRFVYKEVKAPEKLVFVNSFSDEKGGITKSPFAPVWPLEVLNTATFTEYEGKTTLLLKGGPINATEEEMKAFEGFTSNMQQGFEGTFAQLDTYLSTIKK